MHIKYLFGLGALVCFGCVESPTPQSDPPFVLSDAAAVDAAADADFDAQSDAETPDLGLPDAWIEPPIPMNWCARQATVIPDNRDPIVSWSDAHALARYFGPHDSFTDVEDALALALDNAAPRVTYAALLPFVCAVDAGPAEPMPAARVEMRSDVAYVYPGTGALTIPGNAQAVVLDLRALPASDALSEVLQQAADAVLWAPISRTIDVRQMNGLPDEVFSPQSPYSAQPQALSQAPWPGSAAMRPLAVLVGPIMPPEVAELAGAVRIAGQGWLVGAPVYSGVAESRLVAVGDGGLAVRIGTRKNGRFSWPDVVAADASEIDDLSADWLAGEAPPPVVGERTRPRVGEVVFFQQSPSFRLSTGAIRAMLVSAHGAVRRFFPYLDVVGDEIDTRLIEVVSTINGLDEPTRTDARNALYRFSEAFSDGHAFLYDLVAGPSAIAPFVVDHLQDERPVIKRSIDPAVAPGDVIVAIEGEPVADWYADELTRTSAASRGYALDLASRRYLQGNGPLRLQLESLDGAVRDVAIDRVPFAVAPPATPWLRPSGFLDDFDAGDVLYVNMGGDVETDSADLLGRLAAQMPEAQAMIVDMRGYPEADHYRVALRLMGGEGFFSPIFDVPRWTGPDQVELQRNQYSGRVLGGDSEPGFAGPIALLVGPTTVSRAENFSMMLTPFEQVTVIGRRSAATNGNITGLWLPGGFGMTLTGMIVSFVDGSVFHGIGIVPEIEVWPTAASIGAGDDLVVRRAIEHLRAQP